MTRFTRFCPVFFFCLLALVLNELTAAEGDRSLPRFRSGTLSLYLSPSNQVANTGFGKYGNEKQRMNEIADRVEKKVRARGVTVWRNDPSKSIRDYVSEANGHKVDLYFAIHSNASGDGSTRGTEVFCFKFGGSGEQFAKRVNDELIKIYDGPNRGVKESHSHFGPGKPLYETANPLAPAVLVEIAFHDNETDAKWIMAHEQKIADALTRAILFHLAETHPEAVLKGR